MSTLKITVHGTADIQRAFESLDRKVANRILVEALRNNTAHMEQAVREGAPEGATGKLKQSIRRNTKAGRKRRATTTIYASDKIAPHAGDVEFGTGPREKKSNGQYTGEMPANPFMRTAFESEAQATAAAVQTDIALRVEAEAGKP